MGTLEWGRHLKVPEKHPTYVRHQLAAMNPKIPEKTGTFAALAFTLRLAMASVSPGSAETRCSNQRGWHCFLPKMITPICARHLAPCSAILGSWLVAADNTFKHAVAIYWPYKLILVGVQLIEIKA